MIDTSDWKEFVVEELFEVSHGKFKPEKDSVEGDKGVPHFTTTIFNNGIGYYVKDAMFPANCITVASESQGASFFHDYPFSASNIVTVLIPPDNIPLNKYNAEFICTLFKKEGAKYSWGGFKFSTDRVRKTKLKLPVTCSAEPDWSYMEAYMRNIINEAENTVNTLIKIL